MRIYIVHRQAQSESPEAGTARKCLFSAVNSPILQFLPVRLHDVLSDQHRFPVRQNFPCPAVHDYPSRFKALSITFSFRRVKTNIPNPCGKAWSRPSKGPPYANFIGLPSASSASSLNTSPVRRALNAVNCALARAPGLIVQCFRVKLPRADKWIGCSRSRSCLVHSRNFRNKCPELSRILFPGLRFPPLATSTP